ncbi:alpha/beta fold hydrolase [Planktothrix sp. FACHB-1355]|uniref:Alpha/beta fold hydrolase n=1 Tax=Aerosakkonema funiforme FACHB-1375 TaxID=2949571 RepID=A0A926ZFL2_9CYAN|nr:alpha/beta fold hydrolase [Aerosakkonema funiforme]MBD2180965.1 alpha/beta fold hydrolase [Aerosakkonema funiforme FACHB-1375]MBD3557794.1 alpha/beta fold hydrolase [Planktothrix sp. FACHB-1355]
MTTSLHWQQRVGSQRDWVWRGWQTRYTYMRPSQSTGDATTFILLHGFGTSIGHWRHNMTVFSQSHPVYALDMLGFGASEKASAKYNVTLWVEQVYDFWRTFIRQPVVLVGNSIGSLVCIAAAAAHPEMVRGVVMMSLPDPSVEEEMIPRPLRSLVATIKNIVASPPVLQTFFYWVRVPQRVRGWAAIAYANPEAITDELVDILVGPAQDRGSAQAFCAILKAMTSSQFGPSVKSLLPNLNIPLLLIWGSQDKMIPRGLARQFKQYNPNLEVIELDNAGHCPHDECPERVNQIILEWVDAHCTNTRKLDTTREPSKV